MSAYNFSWVKYLKVKYHLWIAERLLVKIERLMKKTMSHCGDLPPKELSVLYLKVKGHQDRAKELIGQMKW